MEDTSSNRVGEARTTFNLDGAGGDLRGALGMASNLHSASVKHYRAKVFKSGNSLAVRIPVGTTLEAGMEMDLTVKDGAYLSLAPVDRPKRKFNIAKVAGSAKSLNYIDRGDRSFEERPSVNDVRATK